MARNSLKYQRIDAAQREIKRAEWNRPVIWPLLLVLVLLLALLLPALVTYRRRERRKAL